MVKHGMRYSPTYKSWSEMKYRCGKNRYKDISFCEEWKDFMNFYADMGERPPGTTLDRIDCKKGYFKENCRWADIYTQQNNRANNHYFVCYGEVLTIPQIARKYKISRGNLANKVYIYHMKIDDAVNYLRGRSDKSGRTSNVFKVNN